MIFSVKVFSPHRHQHLGLERLDRSQLFELASEYEKLVSLL